MYKLAEFMLPRLKNETPPERFADLVRQTLFTLNHRKIVEVEAGDISKIRRTFDELGLINVTSATSSGRVYEKIVVTFLGLEVAKEENLRLNALQKLQKENPLSGRTVTFGHVVGEGLDALIALIGNGCRRLFQ
jgi:hypothetical protein